MELIDGKYRVIRILGQGGCGAVYVCDDPSLGKQVAVKVMLDSCEGASDIKRFRKEAQALSMCDHPSIVKILSFGTCNERSPYYVMELVDGQSLSSIIASEGPLTPERFSLIFDQILSALQHAHEHGLVHRDIKPSNIMVARNGDSEQAFLIDFGLIRNMQSSTRITSTNAVLGTPFYMSPEQCTNGNIDQRSDLYSLGCTMYECATGQPPFTGEALEVLMAHLNEQPHAIPVEIRELIEGCLAKDPADRFTTAEAARDCLRDLDLKKFLHFTRKDASRPAKTSPKNKPNNNSKMLPVLVTACLVVLGLFIACGGLISSQQQSPKQQSVTQPTSPAAREEELFAKAASCHEKALQLIESKSPADVRRGISMANEAISILAPCRSHLNIQNTRMTCLDTILKAQAVIKAPYKERLDAVTSGLIYAQTERDPIFRRKFFLHRARLRSEAGNEKEAEEDFESACDAAKETLPSRMDDVGHAYIEYSRWLRARQKVPEKRAALASKAVLAYLKMKDSKVDYSTWWLDEAIENLLEEKNLACEKPAVEQIIRDCLRPATKDETHRVLINRQTRAARLILAIGKEEESKKLFQQFIAQSLQREKKPQIATAASIHCFLSLFQEIPQKERIKYALTAYNNSRTDDPHEQHAVLSCLIVVAQEYDRAKMLKEARDYNIRAAKQSRPRAYKLLGSSTESDSNLDEALNAALVSRVLVTRYSLALHDIDSAKIYLAEAQEILRDFDAKKATARTSGLRDDTRALIATVAEEVSNSGGGTSQNTASKSAR